MEVTRVDDAVLLLVVRASQDLAGASRTARDLLGVRSGQGLIPAADERAKLAVRVDPRMLDDVSEVLDRAAEAGHRRFQVRESVGVNGVWSLFWLDAGLKPGRGDIGATEESLLEALETETSSVRP